MSLETDVENQEQEQLSRRAFIRWSSKKVGQAWLLFNAATAASASELHVREIKLPLIDNSRKEHGTVTLLEQTPKLPGVNYRWNQRRMYRKLSRKGIIHSTKHQITIVTPTDHIETAHIGLFYDNKHKLPSIPIISVKYEGDKKFSPISIPKKQVISYKNGIYVIGANFFGSTTLEEVSQDKLEPAKADAIDKLALQLTPYTAYKKKDQMPKSLIPRTILFYLDFKDKKPQALRLETESEDLLPGEGLFVNTRIRTTKNKSELYHTRLKPPCFCF